VRQGSPCPLEASTKYTASAFFQLAPWDSNPEATGLRGSGIEKFRGSRFGIRIQLGLTAPEFRGIRLSCAFQGLILETWPSYQSTLPTAVGPIWESWCSTEFCTDRPGTEGDLISCEILASVTSDEDRGYVDANILAGRLNHLANLRGIRVIMLDGPQAWKSVRMAWEHSRVSERQLNTAAKTGLPGMVKPVTYRAFAEFCLDVYDALCRRGWSRYGHFCSAGSPPERVVVESYPYAAWKSLGLKPLPSKRRCKISDLAEAYGNLRSLIPITTNRRQTTISCRQLSAGCRALRWTNRMPRAHVLSATRRVERVALEGGIYRSAG